MPFDPSQKDDNGDVAQRQASVRIPTHRLPSPAARLLIDRFGTLHGPDVLGW